MIRSIPDIQVTDQATRDALEAMKEIIEVMLGRRGSDPNDHVLTRGDSSTIVRLFEALNTGLSHDTLADVSADDHHSESHTVASHNDTTATGTELETLTDNSIANALHRHSELVASDGSPDPALSTDANGNIGINTTDIEAWGGGFSAVEFPGSSILFHPTADNMLTISNAYYDGAWKYKKDGFATYISQSAGKYAFVSAVYGIANDPISWSSRIATDLDGLVSFTNGTGINEFSTDGTLAGDSDDAVPTEKAVATAIAAAVGGAMFNVAAALGTL